MNSPIHLLDVNVLVSLIDPAHVNHDAAHAWFEQVGAAGFATCPITENGLLRVVGHPRYPHTAATPAAVAPLLQGVRSRSGHHFWPDTVSLIGDSRVDTSLLGASGQLTDIYLLTLAVSNGGRLATFDARIAHAAVEGGQAALTVVRSA